MLYPAAATYAYVSGSRRRKKNNRERAARHQYLVNWEASHGFDETGMLTGPAGEVPGELGIRWQQMHEQAVYNYRQRLMGGAQDYLQGAAGNLQRFRPGGAASIESGIYSQMGQQQMQQAQMTEPLNLMRDYERMQAEKAANAAKKAGRLAAVTQIASTIGAVALTAATGGAAAPLAIGMMAGGAAAGARMGNQSLSAAQAPGAQIGPDNEILSPGGGGSGITDYAPSQMIQGGPAQISGAPMDSVPLNQNYLARSSAPGMEPGPSYYQQNQGGDGGLSGGDFQGQQALAGGPQMKGGGYQSGGQQMQQARQSGGPQGGQQGQRGGTQMQASPQQIINQEIANHYALGVLVDKYENDPDYMMIRDSIRTEAMLRSYGSLA